MEEKIAINKQIAKYLHPILGINPNFRRYWDEDEKNYLDILNVEDPMDASVNFWGTIGVSHFPNPIELKDGGTKNISVEILMSGLKIYDNIPNILATCGFYITKNKWEVQPGSVFMRMVDMYYSQLEMSHIMFVSPFLWEDKLQPLKLDSKTVHWLLAIPISQSELDYRNNNGLDALESLLEEKNADIFDLNRKSVI
ncbi:suppressor of fused domain protein [Neisseria montereyensis]|uniref:Suppressor of fused domain protein n=1 Tax=Neisseria montereyensis TaxID=2973938 RepID=A0ABT2FCG3_9NEIS|nr:suppressor of fused domain protein [Neisseria montereyensis]MCS4533828.1 suppressor of fused domain protein [Neisseria montereyensis]